jgi:glutathione S-transferase
MFRHRISAKWHCHVKSRISEEVMGVALVRIGGLCVQRGRAHAQAAQTLRHELKIIDERVAGSHWLVGDKICAADIGVFPLVQLLLRAASKEAALRRQERGGLHYGY